MNQFTPIHRHLLELGFYNPAADFVFQFEPPAGASKIKVKEMKASNQTHKTEGK